MARAPGRTVMNNKVHRDALPEQKSGTLFFHCGKPRRTLAQDGRSPCAELCCRRGYPLNWRTKSLELGSCAGWVRKHRHIHSYRSNYKSYVTEIRAVSDELCRKYKLSVIDTENSNHVAKPYAEWLAEKNGQPTWRTAIRQDVDEAIQQSLTWRQFLNALDRKGYEVRMGRKYPVLRPPGKKRFVRFEAVRRKPSKPHPLSTRQSPCFVKTRLRIQKSLAASGTRRMAPSQAV